MPSNATYVCVPCRRTAKAAGGSPSCQSCAAPMVSAGTRWRPPARGNDRAWALVEQGRFLTERAPMGAHRRWGLAPVLPYRVTAVVPPAPARRSWSPPDLLGRFAAARAAAAAGGPGRLESFLAASAAAPADLVRVAVVRDELVSDAVLLVLGRDHGSADVRRYAISHPRFGGPGRSGATFRRAARDSDAGVRQAMAARLDCPRALLTALVADRSPLVVAAAAGNPGLRVRDLASVPVGLVPPARLGEFVRSRTQVRPEQVDAAVAALQLLAAGAAPGGRLTLAGALGAVSALLAPPGRARR